MQTIIVQPRHLRIAHKVLKSNAVTPQDPLIADKTADATVAAIPTTVLAKERNNGNDYINYKKDSTQSERVGSYSNKTSTKVAYEITPVETYTLKVNTGPTHTVTPFETYSKETVSIHTYEPTETYEIQLYSIVQLDEKNSQVYYVLLKNMDASTTINGEATNGEQSIQMLIQDDMDTHATTQSEADIEDEQTKVLFKLLAKINAMTSGDVQDQHIRQLLSALDKINAATTTQGSIGKGNTIQGEEDVGEATNEDHQTKVLIKEKVEARYNTR